MKLFLKHNGATIELNSSLIKTIIQKTGSDLPSLKDTTDEIEAALHLQLDQMNLIVTQSIKILIDLGYRIELK